MEVSASFDKKLDSNQSNVDIVSSKQDKIISCKVNQIKPNSYKKKHIDPVIIGILDQQKIKFILDTGATTSIINKNILPNNQLIESLQDVTLTTANGTELGLLGKTRLQVYFNDEPFNIICAVVTNLQVDSLLGMDFLEEHSANISIKKSQIKLYKENKKIKINFNNINNNQICSEIIGKSSILSEDQIIKNIVSNSYILKNVPADGYCGLNTLVEILNDKKVNVNTNDIKQLLGINLSKTPIWLEGEDIAAVADFYNFNLIIISQENHPTDTKTAAIVYFKPKREYLIVSFSRCHWTPLKYGTHINANYKYQTLIKITDYNNLTLRTNILKQRIKDNDLTINNICSETLSVNPNEIQTNNTIKNVLNIYSHDKITYDINPTLTHEQQEKIKTLLKKYDAVFSKSKYDLGLARLPPIKIKLIKDTIINLPNFKLSNIERNEVEIQTQELLKAGIIEKSKSAFRNPIFLVGKNLPQGDKKGSIPKEYRMVLDYRKLNSIIDKESFPMPLIQNIYDCLAGNKFYSVLDVSSAFYQLALEKDCRPITAFSTQTGHYQFTRLPMGLNNAPALYQAAACKIMSDLNYRNNVCYLDDCVTFGKNFDDYLISLELTLQRFLEYNLKLKPSKCKFGYQELKILGNIIDTKGIRPTEEGLDSIKKFPSPKTIKELRSFLGLANYFRKFIPKFSNISKPLTDLTKGKFKSKKEAIIWKEEHEIAFQELKNKLTNKPVLAHFDENFKTIIVTDGSKKGLGVILQQVNNNNEIHPVSFASKKLTKSENNYSAMELEVLAIGFAFTHFRQYLHGRPVEVWTDHKNLTSLLKIKTESTIVNRLRTKLMGYDINIIYKMGIFNKAADHLSRYPYSEEDRNEIIKNNNIEQININLIQPINIKEDQDSDIYLKNIITAITKPKTSNLKWIRKSKNYLIKSNNVLYYKTNFNNCPNYVLALPSKYIQSILNENHENPLSAHVGFTKTYSKIRTKYYWPKMRKEIKNYVLSCFDCQKRKPYKITKIPKIGFHPLHKGEIMQEIIIDYMGPITSSRGYKYILVATDRVSKYCIAKPFQNANSKSTVKFLLELILRFGPMKVIRSDNGTHFTAQTVLDLLEALHIDKKFGIPFKPTSQGQVERQNQTLIDMISPYVQANNKWADYLPYIVYAYNNSIHQVTGYTPHYLVHGYNPKSIFDIALIPPTDVSVIAEINKLKHIRKTITDKLKNASEQNKRKCKNTTNTIHYKKDDEVLVKVNVRENKFSNRYEGPYKIIKQIGPFSYLINMPKHGKFINSPVHTDQIKPFYNREQ